MESAQTDHRPNNGACQECLGVKLPRPLEQLRLEHLVIQKLHSEECARYHEPAYDLGGLDIDDDRFGGSAIVYRVEILGNEAANNEDSDHTLACKKVCLKWEEDGSIKDESDWKLKAVVSEIRALDKLERSAWTLNLEAVFYLETSNSNGASVYLILSPWLNWSFEAFIKQLASGGQVEGTPSWYDVDDPNYWPHFIAHCVFGLGNMFDVAKEVAAEFDNMDEITAISYAEDRPELFQRIRHKDVTPNNILLDWIEDEGMVSVFIDTVNDTSVTYDLALSIDCFLLPLCCQCYEKDRRLSCPSSFSLRPEQAGDSAREECRTRGRLLM